MTYKTMKTWKYYSLCQGGGTIWIIKPEKNENIIVFVKVGVRWGVDGGASSFLMENVNIYIVRYTSGLRPLLPPLANPRAFVTILDNTKVIL